MNENEYSDLLSLLQEMNMTPAQLRRFCEAAMAVVAAYDTDNSKNVLKAVDHLVGVVEVANE